MQRKGRQRRLATDILRGNMSKTTRISILACVTLLLVISLAGAEQGMLYAVKVDGKWGYIDRSGAVVIQPRFDKALDYTEGLDRKSVV